MRISRVSRKDDIQEALEKAKTYLDGGSCSGNDSKHQQAKKVMDWEQDEQIIFSAINKVAGTKLEQLNISTGGHS